MHSPQPFCGLPIRFGEDPIISKAYRNAFVTRCRLPNEDGGQSMASATCRFYDRSGRALWNNSCHRCLAASMRSSWNFCLHRVRLVSEQNRLSSQR
jgi:hypothetical protein